MYYLAIDIGASSGRHILCESLGGKMVLTEVYRFDNNLCEKDGHTCWDSDELFCSIVEGMKKCGELGKIPASVAIDTWGVDFVLLDEAGSRISETVSYRDGRTQGMDALCEEIIPFEEHYKITGIQKQVFNTVYQLLALKKESPEVLEKASRLLMMPEYFTYLLTGEMKSEYTIATTSGLVNAADKDWDRELIEKLGLPGKIFGRLYMPMDTAGPLKDEIAKEVGYQTEVVFAAAHDTGSAFLAVPAKDENAVYISSGTWSLLGVEIQTPITDKASMLSGFTNEGGLDCRYRYLKNIMGLWIIQSVRRNYNKKYSFAQLEALAREEKGFKGRIDVNDKAFLAPENMAKTVAEKASVKPENIGQLMECIYQSLAESYRDSIGVLKGMTKVQYTSVNIVGGGSKDSYLNQLTAEKTGLPVYAGPTEGTALGNIIAQMLKSGEFTSLQNARDAIKKSFEIKLFQ